MRILVLHERHGDRYFNATEDEDLIRSCVEVIEERLETGYWYDDEAKREIEQMFSSKNLSEAKSFLFRRARQGFAYEGVSLHEVVG